MDQTHPIRHPVLTLTVAVGAALVGIFVWLPWVSSAHEPELAAWGLWIGLACGLVQSASCVWLEEGEVASWLQLNGSFRYVIKGLAFLASPPGTLILLVIDVPFALSAFLGSSLTYGALLSPSIAAHVIDSKYQMPHEINGHLFIALMALSVLLVTGDFDPPMPWEDAVGSAYVTGIFVGCAGGSIVRTIVAFAYMGRLGRKRTQLWKALYFLVGPIGAAGLAFVTVVSERFIDADATLLRYFRAGLFTYVITSFVTWGGLKNPWPEVNEADW